MPIALSFALTSSQIGQRGLIPDVFSLLGPNVPIASCSGLAESERADKDFERISSHLGGLR
jgi:hypothetical protein